MEYGDTTILIIDDNLNNIQVVMETLKPLGCEMLYATSGQQGIERAENSNPDLILLDIMMPGMDGFETARRIKAQTRLKETPIIFLTAKTDGDSIQKAFELGGVDYVTKPFNPSELKSRTITHIRLRHLTLDLKQAVEIKTRELKQSLITDKSTGAFNLSKLSMDLQDEREYIGAMLHLRNTSQLEISYGIDAVERLLSNMVDWINAQSYPLSIYRASFANLVLLFDHNDLDRCESFLKQIQEEVEKLDVELLSQITASYNLLTTLARGKGNELIQKLRVAQIEAKNRGMPFYRYLDGGMEVIKKQENNLYWMQRLKESLNNDTVVPFYQPIVDIRSGEVVRYECLVRIKEKDEIISPLLFIDAAKQLGAITAITKRVLEKSFERFAGTTVGLSINVTKEDLVEGYLPEMLTRLSKQFSVAPSSVALEVLEEISVFGSEKVISELHVLKKMGYKIALDDFGSENASFSRMLDIDVDILKIDGIFVKHIHEHEISYKIVKSIVKMAQSLGYKVVAEYVHSQEVLDVVRRLEIDYAQGYYYSPPLEDPGVGKG